MERVKESQAEKFESSPTTTIFEYRMGDKQINGAIAEINGRYPEEGRVVNEESKEMVFVLEGGGKVVVEGREIQFQKGDLLLIVPGEKYFWEGEMKIFMANTPAWKPEQHKFVK